MKYHAKIEVSLKLGHSDPEGQTTSQLLNELGYKTDSVRVSKEYNVLFIAKDLEDARAKAEEMCKRVLANPTKDNYTIGIEEQK
jgi:phosphoribosylformylglycinamidine synthase subunit PurS